MDVYGNIVATERSPAAVTSAGATGQYVFANQQVYTTSSPAYVTVLNPSGVALNFTGTPTVSGPFAIVTGAGAGTCNLPGSVAPARAAPLASRLAPRPTRPIRGALCWTATRTVRHRQSTFPAPARVLEPLHPRQSRRSRQIRSHLLIRLQEQPASQCRPRSQTAAMPRCPIPSA